MSIRRSFVAFMAVGALLALGLVVSGFGQSAAPAYAVRFSEVLTASGLVSAR